MRCFNSYLYFYCVNNGINPLTVAVDLSRVPPIVAEGQSHVELPEKLWDRTEQIEGHERVILFESYQPSISVSQLSKQE